tara:strand:- start:705 stop:980 length:276 start_codon:yes stop_codon:yes gene_type:complete
MRLALKLSNVDVDSMLHTLSAAQFVEWLRFSAIEPFGSRVEQIHLAGLRTQVANYLRKQGSEAFQIGDFLIGYTPKLQERQMSVEEIYNRM